MNGGEATGIGVTTGVGSGVGMGGKVGLKGTDGVVKEAIAKGAEPVAPQRAIEFLIELKHRIANPVEVLCCPGLMGANEAQAAGISITEDAVDRELRKASEGYESLEAWKLQAMNGDFMSLKELDINRPEVLDAGLWATAGMAAFGAAMAASATVQEALRSAW